MLGSTGPATATIHTSTSSATPTSPTRPSRLRGLSYLRSYTHNHLHAHLSSSAGSNSGTSTPTLERHPSTPRLTRSSSNPTASAFQPQSHEDAPTAGERRVAETVGITEGENGWLPSVQGRSGLSRESLHPTSTTRESVSPDPPATMTRNRAATAVGPTAAAANLSSRHHQPQDAATADMPGSGGEATTAGASAASSMPEASSSSGRSKAQMPTIRFIPHVEPPSSRAHHRPSLHFTAMSRTLKTPTSVVRVGRYSERDNTSPDPNTLPVGFKSKVVSRRHCELWYNTSQSQWYIRDVKSSSGTFLNHVRLSPPGQESRPYAVNDGDVVQLGIDFKGGEEIIFRCVKIRIECNRSWQKGLNKYNTSAHRKLLKQTSAGGGKKKDNKTTTDSTAGATTTNVRDNDADAASVNTTSSTSECSICLNPVRPCQALFVAPCGHVWHYKCVRNLVHGPSYPHFLCPNCRFVADLEADVEPDEEEEEGEEEEEEEGEGFNEVGEEEGEWEPFVADEDVERGGRDEGLVGASGANDREGGVSDSQREREGEETEILNHSHPRIHNDPSEEVDDAANTTDHGPHEPQTMAIPSINPTDDPTGLHSPAPPPPPPPAPSHPPSLPHQTPSTASIPVPTPLAHRPTPSSTS
ncbi:SMAD/FHA domain-containing protein, partial [Hortaea werneckii]